jgi:hypothetical protein
MNLSKSIGVLFVYYKHEDFMLYLEFLSVQEQGNGSSSLESYENLCSPQEQELLPMADDQSPAAVGL